jgi:hypothetical protein
MLLLRNCDYLVVCELILDNGNTLPIEDVSIMPKKWTENGVSPQPRKKKEILIGEQARVAERPKSKGGRPMGISARQKIWDEKVVPHYDAIYQSGLDLARGGDPTMVKFFLDRISPKNPMRAPLALSSDAVTMLDNIMQAYAGDEVSAEEAVKLSTIVKDKVTIGEVRAFMERMKQFEAWVADQNQGVTFNGGMEADGGQSKELDSGSDNE